MHISDSLNIRVDVNSSGVVISARGWDGFKIGPAVSRVAVGSDVFTLHISEFSQLDNGEWHLKWESSECPFVVEQTIKQSTLTRVQWSTKITNTSTATVPFELIDLLTTQGVPNARFDLGSNLGEVRIMENADTGGQVRSVAQILSGCDGLHSLGGTRRSFQSRGISVVYNPNDKVGFLVGFDSYDRWYGAIGGGFELDSNKKQDGMDNVDGVWSSFSKMCYDVPSLDAEDRISAWTVSLPGGGIPVAPGVTLNLEEFSVEIGTDPFKIQDDYADRLAERYEITDLPEPFANWCSWYPYRLGVTEENILETAKVAKERRLDELGLRYIQVDLGWEKEDIACYFDENERFSHGLKYLSDGLKKLGFELGAWCGFTCISADHPIYLEHPEWLVSDESGKPSTQYKWFWKPHYDVYNLDATHPGAVEWVKKSIESLAERGVRFLKWDFGGNLRGSGHFHDPSVAATDSIEAFRRVATVVQDAMNSQGEEGLVINCTNTHMGSLGLFKLIYGNNDTGNTESNLGHLRNVYMAVATNRYKNRRLGLVQPSCIVVGLPGTLEEARVRSTTTFMIGGHVDISENLIHLQEDRWQVLLSAMPAGDTSAKPVDLFYPVKISSLAYDSAQGSRISSDHRIHPQGANVWHSHVVADWDEWDLVAVFNIADPDIASNGYVTPRRFEIPFDVIGLCPDSKYWAHEFWSCQFLGEIPIPQLPAGTYTHLGYLTSLVDTSEPGMLDIVFGAPAVKHLVIRKPRTHPWPVGTTFHQSGGSELSNVAWDEASHKLTGELNRPKDQSGSIAIAGVPIDSKCSALVGGQEAVVTLSANGSRLIQITSKGNGTKWSLTVH